MARSLISVPSDIQDISVNGTCCVSVVVPAHNEALVVGRFLQALERQTMPSDNWEVIVVDDASEDGTADLARGFDGVTVCTLDHHGGAYVARNLGAGVAAGELLAFTDIDCEPAADWLSSGCEAFRDRQVRVLAGHIDVPLGDRPSLVTLLDVCNFVDQERAAARGYALGGNLWIRRELFADLGGFNERLRSGGDQELSRRAGAAGARPVYAPEVRVTHEPYARVRDLARKARRIGYGAAAHRVHADGPLRERPLMCNRPGYYLPWRKLHGAERLDRLGYRLSRRRKLAMLGTRYLVLQLPMVLGNLEGALKAQAARVDPRL